MGWSKWLAVPGAVTLCATSCGLFEFGDYVVADDPASSGGSGGSSTGAQGPGGGGHGGTTTTGTGGSGPSPCEGALQDACAADALCIEVTDNGDGSCTMVLAADTDVSKAMAYRSNDTTVCPEFEWCCLNNTEPTWPIFAEKTYGNGTVQKFIRRKGLLVFQTAVVPGDATVSAATLRVVYAGGNTNDVVQLYGGDQPVWPGTIYQGDFFLADTLLDETDPVPTGSSDVLFEVPPGQINATGPSGYAVDLSTECDYPQNNTWQMHSPTHADPALRPHLEIVLVPAE